MSFPRYPAYKDSAVSWIGNVPVHWESWKLSHAFESIGSGTTPPSTEPQWYEGGNTPWVTTGELRENIVTETAKGVTDAALKQFTALRVHPAGSLVIAMYGATIGRLGVLGVDAATNQACCVLSKPKALTIAFSYYWLQGFKQIIIDLFSTGGGQPNISQDVVSSLRVPAPEIQEQKQITEFLDRETAKIDALVAEQEQLITLLKEKRQAVISHAVTKGLDPSVPMKDSGIDWLGEVPAHWGIGKVKKFFATSSGSTPNTDKQDAYYNGDIPWIRSLDLTDGDIVEWEVGITPAAIDDTACKLLPVGTVLVAMYGGDGTIGKNGLLRILAATNQAICALLPSPQFEPEFVLAFMQHQRPYWMVGAEGTRKDPNISQDRVRNALMPCPPLPEQRVIVEHVKQALSAFGSLEKEAEAVIGILNERRSALISAAVTGQIDVRGLAPAQEQAA